MTYEVIAVDGEVNAHFLLISDHVKNHKHGAKFENPHLEQVWRHKVGQHDVIYQAHVKTGHLGDHHHFTILWEVKGNHAKLLKV